MVVAKLRRRRGPACYPRGMEEEAQNGSGEFRPSRSMGQCFLIDTQVITRVVAAVAPVHGETILEIGAGTGQLSLPILRTGARLLCLEADHHLAKALREAVPPELEREVQIIQDNALKIDFSRLLEASGLGRVRVCGNLPYSVAAPILLRLLALSILFKEFTFMFQDEVASRLTARSGTKAYGVLSVLAQQRASIRTLFRISPQAFRPQPRVVSTLVRFNMLESDVAPDVGDDQTFRAVVKGLLAHRRKTIANNVKHLQISGLLEKTVQEALSELEIDPSRRAETLSVKEFAALSRVCSMSQARHFLPNG